MKTITIIWFLLSMTNAQAYFNDSYESARKVLKTLNTQAEHSEFEINGHKTDVYYYPPTQKKEKLIVLISGTHGVEGHLGSAIQSYFIQNHLKDIKRENNGVLIVHALNAWGYSNNRRVTKNNVDLNRNFVIDQHKNKNLSYEKFDSFLNKENPVHFSFFKYPGFILQVLKYLYKYSMKDLRQSILQGQYAFPKGIFFGGQDYEPQEELINSLNKNIISEYPEVLAIDLHSGYGERGTLHLFGESHYQDRAKEELKKVFQGLKIDFPSDDDFYAIKGGLLNYLAHKSPENQLLMPMIFEYGTLNSQTTLGSLDSLYRVINENQSYHHGSNDQNQAKNDFKEMFYPSDKAWRENVLKETQIAFAKIMENYFSEK